MKRGEKFENIRTTRNKEGITEKNKGGGEMKENGKSRRRNYGKKDIPNQPHEREWKNVEK